ncbi:MAG TPA: hypothetical protein DIC28_05750 [Aerococcus urinaeequi]|nr:hypothetical protein [Aerococcus urinaeequi]
MEELAIKIAEMLDISVQGAIDMYPVIRGQYIWYQTLTNVRIWSAILAFALMIMIGVIGVIRDDTAKFNWTNDEIREEWVNIDKAFKKAIWALVVFVVIAIVSTLVTPFLAPDIMIIKNFLG